MSVIIIFLMLLCRNLADLFDFFGGCRHKFDALSTEDCSIMLAHVLKFAQVLLLLFKNKLNLYSF